VVKAFVEMHGGTVRVDTEVGHGTTFTITLPVHAPAGVSPAEALVRDVAPPPAPVETAPATS
jgi:hypothetical protein